MKDNLKLIMKNAYANMSNYKVAIANAFSEGFSVKDFKEIHVMGSSKGICMPCFMCRELLHEYFLPDAKVFCYNNRGKCKEFTVADICPYPFNLED